MNAPNKISMKTTDRVGSTPAQIARDPGMAIEDKRALLASWASDARAVPDHPALRRLDDGSLVHIDDVLAALKSLDRVDLGAEVYDSRRASFRRGHWSRIGRRWRRSRDDDDDDNPPPVPASTAPHYPMPGGSLAAAAA